jgi:hypothetical protein
MRDRSRREVRPPCYRVRRPPPWHSLISFGAIAEAPAAFKDAQERRARRQDDVHVDRRLRKQTGNRGAGDVLDGFGELPQMGEVDCLQRTEHDRPPGIVGNEYDRIVDRIVGAHAASLPRGACARSVPAHRQLLSTLPNDATGVQGKEHEPETEDRDEPAQALAPRRPEACGGCAQRQEQTKNNEERNTALVLVGPRAQVSQRRKAPRDDEVSRCNEKDHPALVISGATPPNG